MKRDDGLYYHQLSLIDPEWYESFDYYQPSDELFRVIRAITPATWQLSRGNVWFRLRPSGITLPSQGWKIHISATPINCENVLATVAAICIQQEVSFKFLLDRRLVRLATSKGWRREAAGKFITIYPLNDHQFHELIETLYAALQGSTGPYVLSDRRYRDSQVVYYRYGGISGLSVLTVGGDRKYVLVSPDGEFVPDWRTPYWNPPAWITDPFESSDDEDHEPVLKDGRYRIERALGFSVTGGVYVATDRATGNSVVVKEARPATGVDDNGQDAADRLQKEYRLLQTLQHTGVAPLPIDLFWEWEHRFLVEEFLDGADLGNFTIGTNPLLRVNPTETTISSYVTSLRNIWINLATAVDTIHANGIICGDLSLKNVIVTDLNSGCLRILDLESSWEEALDPPTPIATRGYTSPTHRSKPSREDDFYSLGAIMLGTLFPLNNITEVAPSATAPFVEALGTDLGLPPRVRLVVQDCLSYDVAARPTPRQVAETIRESPHWCLTMPDRTSVDPDNMLSVVSGVADYICASITPQRQDRLFPADPRVFYTNPLSIAHGAVGVAYALSRVGRELPRPVLAWILSHPVNPDRYPPGLYLGSAGIAWVLLDLGLQDVAVQILRSIDHHPLLWDQADILYGAAGYGLTCLRFYLDTGDQVWLDRATQVGEWLLRTKIEEDERVCWPDNEGLVWLGYARGASGIALYLLYLSLATGDRQFLTTGERALAFDLAHVQVTEEGHLSIPRGTVGRFENVITQYWSEGSAGVGTTLVRYWVYTRNPEYYNALCGLAQDTFRKYTVFPSLFRGLAGLGNFLLDAYEFTGEERYLAEAYRTAEGVMLFKIPRSTGIAFPGEQLFRISADFATGSAGVGLFLHRLAHADRRLGNFNFTLDQFLHLY